MKISITDQFLLDILYPFLSITGDVTDFLLSNKYQQIHIIFGNDNPVISKYKKDKQAKHFYQFIQRLKKNNYIKVQSLKNKKSIMLTKGGFEKVLKASFKVQDHRKRKDGKWIMVIFDIPQTHKKARNLLRSVLKNLGYKMFQQSVWVTPYDVSEKTETLLQHYSLDKNVKVSLIEEL